MASVGRIARLVARAAAWCALVALVSLPLGGVVLRGVTAVAAGVLRIVDRPVVLTSLTSRGDQVVIGSHLTGLAQPLATWDATNLPIFLVATLGLALAAPAVSRRRRVQTLLAALVASVVTMVATVALQLEVTAANEARASLGLALHDRRDVAWLAAANEGIGVAMLLVPALLFASAYVRFRADGAAAPGTAPPRRLGLAGIAALATAVVCLGLAAVGAAPVDPRPGLLRVVRLNPGAPQAHQALASYDALAAIGMRMGVLTRDRTRAHAALPVEP